MKLLATVTSLRSFLFLTIVAALHAYQICEGGGLCPDDNTCCPTMKNGVSTCITGKYAGEGACCMDTIAGTTGCGEGFECAYDAEFQTRYCQKVHSDEPDTPDRLPRYQSCQLPAEALTQVYGLPIVEIDSSSDSSRVNNHATDNEYPQLAYLSTMGALDSTDPAVLNQQFEVETILIMVHGSERNVEDYICAANSALPKELSTSSSMVVAPWFMSTEDNTNLTFYNRPRTIRPLRWSDGSPIAHSFRYGANAVNEILVEQGLNVSSYYVMDAIVEQILSSRAERFPNLRKIVIAGHSAGGQYMQRWVLLSNSRVFDEQTSVPLRVVVANPRSLCFLDERRMINGTLTVPDTAEDCDWYNQWEWGLGPGDALDVPYKDQAIEEAGGVQEIVRRYPDRDVVYLAGEKDIYSFGDRCQDLLQGPFRRARSENFFKSLPIIFGRPVHHRLVVSGVHHDHTLMFQSPEGQQALWGALRDSSEIDSATAI